MQRLQRIQLHEPPKELRRLLQRSRHRAAHDLTSNDSGSELRADCAKSPPLPLAAQRRPLTAATVPCAGGERGRRLPPSDTRWPQAPVLRVQPTVAPAEPPAIEWATVGGAAELSTDGCSVSLRGGAVGSGWCRAAPKRNRTVIAVSTPNGGGEPPEVSIGFTMAPAAKGFRRQDLRYAEGAWVYYSSQQGAALWRRGMVIRRDLPVLRPGAVVVVSVVPRRSCLAWAVNGDEVAVAPLPGGESAAGPHDPGHHEARRNPYDRYSVCAQIFPPDTGAGATLTIFDAAAAPQPRPARRRRVLVPTLQRPLRTPTTATELETAGGAVADGSAAAGGATSRWHSRSFWRAARAFDAADQSRLQVPMVPCMSGGVCYLLPRQVSAEQRRRAIDDGVTRATSVLLCRDVHQTPLPSPPRSKQRRGAKSAPLPAAARRPSSAAAPGAALRVCCAAPPAGGAHQLLPREPW